MITSWLTFIHIPGNALTVGTLEATNLRDYKENTWEPDAQFKDNMFPMKTSFTKTNITKALSTADTNCTKEETQN